MKIQINKVRNTPPLRTYTTLGTSKSSSIPFLFLHLSWAPGAAPRHWTDVALSGFG